MNRKNFDRICESNKYCPECGSRHFENDNHRAEVYCKECGTVVSCPEHYINNRKVVADYGYDYTDYPVVKDTKVIK